MLTSVSDTEQTDYKGKIFIGQVVDNNDPLKLERVRVTIPSLYQGEVSNLPWCAPKTDKGFGNKAGVGVFSVPVLGTWVYVELQDGDAHYPVYVGSPVQNKTDLPEADVNYPNRYGSKDQAGNLFYVDTTPGSNVLHIRHASGTQITVNNDGSVSIASVGDITSSAPNWNHTGDMTITGDVDVTGTVDATVDVKAGPLNISLVTHKHPGVLSGGSNTGPSIP